MQEYKIETPEKMPEKRKGTKNEYLTPKERKQNKHNTLEYCLQEIYQNLRTVMTAIEILHPYCQDKGFSNLLKRQYEEYTLLMHDLIKNCKQNDINLKDISQLGKFFLTISTALNTIADKSNAYLADLIIQGIELGISRISKVQNILAERAATNEYADRLMVLYDQNLEDMKLFL